MSPPSRKAAYPAAANDGGLTSAAAAKTEQAQFDKDLAAVAEVAAEIQEMACYAVSQSLKLTKSAFAELQTAADEARVSTRASGAVISNGMLELSAKALESFWTNASAAFALAKGFSSVRKPNEAIILQTEFARKQYQTLNAQAKELSSLAQKVAVESAASINDQFGQGFKVN